MVRDSVLALLENNRGSLISGGFIAKQLNVSRTAVWKAITSLKQDGFNIDSISGEGYRLAEDNDILTIAGIKKFLKTEILGNELLVLDTVSSTNTLLKQQFSDNKENGFVLIADHQTEGRGRQGRTFHSPAESGIYMSILLRPKLGLDKINLITVAGAVAVTKAICETAGFTPQIKWVNDILYKNRKLCGILTEASLEAETGLIDYIVLGIGINVHKAEKIPLEISNIYASLSEFSDKKLLRNELSAAILNNLEICYNQIINDDESLLLDEYRSYMSFLGKKITVHTSKDSYPATALSINNSGHLVVLKDDNSTEILLSGEISIVL